VCDILQGGKNGRTRRNPSRNPYDAQPPSSQVGTWHFHLLNRGYPLLLSSSRTISAAASTLQDFEGFDTSPTALPPHIPPS
jgi:hypothetical protein